NLMSFLTNYFINKDYKPIQCVFMLFKFPNEEYIEPMAKLIYPNDEKFDNLKIKDDIETNFKEYLVKKSENLDKFKNFRKIQKKFRIIVQRE
ncbi:MAG: hypothetical protein ACFFA0_14860, partial [Promethearchaeota archaeon]